MSSKYLDRILQKVTYESPKDYEDLLAIEGVGPKTVRSLSLLSEIIYGAKPSFEDPARFSFAHGGKDGIPYPVDRETYDRSIEILRNWIERSKAERTEKLRAFERLNKFTKTLTNPTLPLE